MNEEAHHQLQSGTLDQSRSTFSLLAHDNSTMTCEWTRPLCEDPAVKEELAEIEALGTDPVFTVSVCSYVA